MEFEDALNVADELVFLKAGRRLTSVELAILKGAYNRRTYDQIANDTSYSPNYLKFDIAPKLWKLLSDAFGETVGKTTLQAALERQWRKQQSSGTAKKVTSKVTDNAVQQQPDLTLASAPSCAAPNIDWGEAPDISVFYGRTTELETLTQWMQRDSCRLIALLGMGGIGKTSLAAKLVQDLQDEFEFVIWRSLRNAPQLKELLGDIVPFLSRQQDAQATPERLLHWLRTHRCLLVLDNLETILQPGHRVGVYLPGYENYGTLLRMLGETRHQSCVLLTSREKPVEVSTFEAEDGKVRSHLLCGSLEASLSLLDSKKLTGTEAEKYRLCEFYNFSPLALKIVAASIQSLFDGNISTFLVEETMVFNGLHKLLDQQFSRLTEPEKIIMYWLAINREWTTTTELIADITPSITRATLLESLESLTWRALIEQQTGQYTLQPVVMEYVTDTLIQTMAAELVSVQPVLFERYALLKTTVLDYIGESQRRLILSPLAEMVQASFHNTETLQEHFQALLQHIRDRPTAFFSYGVGNLINLALQLDLDLTGYDFSQLKIRQVNFQGKQLFQINLSHCDLKDCLFTQTFGGILAVAFSPDNTKLAFGETHGILRLWQIISNQKESSPLEQPLLTLKGHLGAIMAVTWHPDGSKLASSSDDYTMKIWDAQTGNCLLTLQEHQKAIWDVKWSPDGNLLASSSGDGIIKLWDSETGACLQTLVGHQSLVRSVAWSPDGILASGSEDHTIRLWDVAEGKCLKTLTIKGARVRRVAWSPDGEKLASGSSDRQVRIWDRRTGQCLKTLTGHAFWVDALTWSPDGQTLASSSSDRTIKLWDSATGDCLRTLQGHQDPIWGLSWWADSKTLISGSYDQTLRFWNTEIGQCRRVIHGYINAIRNVTWSPDGQSLASCSTDKTIKIWQVATGERQTKLIGHQGWVFSVDWCPNFPHAFGQENVAGIVASSSTDATIKLWDVKTGQCFRTLLGHTSWVWSVAWSPDGQRLASGSSSNDLTARIWNPVTGECLHILAGHESWIWWVAWSPDGRMLATAGDDQRINLWDVETGECLKTLHDQWLLGVAIAWSPDSQWLATSSKENTVRLWNLQTGICERELSGHQAIVWAISWSPDGNYLASGSDDCTIKIWNLQTDECSHTLIGHQSRIWGVSWSPKGDFLASSSTDETIRVWDIARNCWQILRSDRPYEGMNITGITGITEAQKATLTALGAIEG
ncbi:hypothetical protein A4S05_21835 [Nostoc sp. KVJ20]|uniref:WD40 repeat domain-containing protein n=1 Tax=Nostoc sp. KVJ20 TaxID=457944 RepID=UPI00083DE5A7|nr:NB-ARC domain-containing protein [Nostoc sp. KVJ20]ODH02904.1 hypothetical protein A4S05_21835 [Nostoc sp. KVJ20]